MPVDVYKEFVTPNIEVNDIEIKRLFHYTSPEGLMGILKERKIRVTDAQYLNDRAEFVEIYRVLNKVIDEYGEKLKHIGEIRDSLELNKKENIYCDNVSSITENGIKNDEIRYYVFCTSTEQDSASMWNYYVKNGDYEGYNICFDKKELSNSIKGNIKFPYDFLEGKVIYRDSEKEKIIAQALTRTNQRIEDRSISDELDIDCADYNEYIDIICDEVGMLYYEIESLSFFFKSEVFIHENEYRYVFSHLESLSNNFVKDYSVKKGVITPYYYVKYDENTISGISIAPLIEFNLAKVGICDFLKNNKWSLDNIDIYQSKAALRY